MRLYDRLRDGEPQTEAPAARPGRVGAGEALEDLLQLLRREGRALVFERKMAAVPPAALQLQPDGAAGGVFAGVVEQDLHELAELPLVAAYRQLRLHLRLERQPALIERGLKQQRRGLGDLAEADGGKRGLRPGVFRPRQLQQPLDQRAHLLRHGADAVGELLLLRLVVVRALQQLGVGEDDG